ncbi:HAD-IA family hydrolase [Streptomyces sp. NRRL S-646]|uniref:HAD-IA family hydrolase n=1 Tax=Streptomyces sp. NRRL S-646 TaxID=1463917 RepID=UPI0004C9D66D|nr:HAD-IA family hydrolase [Streptomyces sp. NRRL S-646]
MTGELRAVLFDSGGVLIRPIGGRWNQRADFEAYAISAVLGCRKPDPRMYRHASDALGLRAAECVFVDDDPELVAAAIELGCSGRALCRDGVPAGGRGRRSRSSRT